MSAPRQFYGPQQFVPGCIVAIHPDFYHAEFEVKRGDQGLVVEVSDDEQQVGVMWSNGGNPTFIPREAWILVLA